MEKLLVSPPVQRGQVTAARAALTTFAVASALVTSMLVGGTTSLSPSVSGAAAAALAEATVARESGPWESTYSERFPGCVAMVLWPRDELPVALVVRTTGGDIARVPLRAFREGVAGPARLGRPIGACR